MSKRSRWRIGMIPEFFGGIFWIGFQYDENGSQNLDSVIVSMSSEKSDYEIKSTPPTPNHRRKVTEPKRT